MSILNKNQTVSIVDKDHTKKINDALNVQTATVALSVTRRTHFNVFSANQVIPCSRKENVL